MTEDAPARIGPAMLLPSFQFDPARGFGVYVHWPYCTRICPYCDFNVYAAKSRDPAPMLDAILLDLEGWRRRTGARRVDTVFLGGGTPSLLSGALTGRLLQTIDGLWGLSADAEITLEANPDDVERFADSVAAGVNRLSLGVQSLRDDSLRFLGRTHDARDAIAALDQARALVPSVSLDLIYALPGQGLSDWEQELREALALAPDHLSLYQLTVEGTTPFGRQVARGAWSPVDEDGAADLYLATQALCGEAGYQGYEISNHARAPNHQSRHNRIYWACGDWVGAGPGAHGRLTADGVRLAIETIAQPAAYLRALAETGLAWKTAEPLSALDEARERVSMGLRIEEGFAVSDITALGLGLDAAQIAHLQELGMLQHSAGRCFLSGAGRLAADRIAALISP